MFSTLVHIFDTRVWDDEGCAGRWMWFGVEICLLFVVTMTRISMHDVCISRTGWSLDGV